MPLSYSMIAAHSSSASSPAGALSRKLHPAGPSPNPVATENRIRDGADAVMGYPRFGMLDLLKLLGGLLVGLFPRYLIRDRDTSYGAAVTRRLQAMGIRDRPITPRSPWQNGHVERLIGSIRRECLNHVVVGLHRHYVRTA